MLYDRQITTNRHATFSHLTLGGGDLFCHPNLREFSLDLSADLDTTNEISILTAAEALHRTRGRGMPMGRERSRIRGKLVKGLPSLEEKRGGFVRLVGMRGLVVEVKMRGK